MTSAISGTPSPTATGGVSSSPNAFAALSQNYETFLKLLTTQLQNQDPLQPQDSSEFTKQLVSFSQVEQQISTNQKLDKLIAGNGQNEAIQALGYIGKTVEFSGDVLPLQGGKAEFGVTLAAQTREAVAEVYDTGGRMVASFPLQNTVSTQPVTWNGRDSAGRQLDDGMFQVKVKAKAQNGDPVQSLIRSSGRVTGVDQASGETQLLLGTIPIGLASILSVRNA